MLKIRSIYLFFRHMHTSYGLIAAGISIPKTIKNKINVSLFRLIEVSHNVYGNFENSWNVSYVSHFHHLFIYDSLHCNNFCGIYKTKSVLMPLNDHFVVFTGVIVIKVCHHSAKLFCHFLRNFSTCKNRALNSKNCPLCKMTMRYELMCFNRNFTA